MQLLDVSRSILSSSLAAWRGSECYRPAQRQPELPLELYDMENCPYCRLVRETLTELDLDVVIRPCPKGGQRFRPFVIADGGKALFPYLVDPNTNVRMYESADIMEYLGETYGRRVGGTRGAARARRVLESSLASAANGMRGLRARPSRSPELPLELFSFEASPYSRLVRERLCELELPYLLRNTGKAHWKDIGPPQVRDRIWRSEKGTGRNRRALVERTGHVQVPYLVDPNTGVEMFESAEICDYLDRTYGMP